MTPIEPSCTSLTRSSGGSSTPRSDLQRCGSGTTRTGSPGGFQSRPGNESIDVPCHPPRWCSGVGLTRRTIELVAPGHRGRFVAGLAFVLLTVAAAILVGRRLTHASWPLDHAEPALAAAAALSYLASYLFRARGWHRLFPPEECPDQARCLASVGAAAASGVVLPFRLDYIVKVGMLRKLGGIRIGFQAIVLSIISLGMIDAIAMLPLSISATATSGSVLRGPLLIVVLFGVGCCTLLVVGGRLIRLPPLRRSCRLRAIRDHVLWQTTT